MKADPVVDVGMTAHERPRLIAEAVESVLAQNYGAWSLTIHDDGPGGGSIEAAVAPYLGDDRVRYLPTGRPVSAVEAMTEVMGIGEGHYFAFLHDDDAWGPRFLDRRVAFLTEHPECGYVFSGHTDIDPVGRELNSFEPPLSEGVVPASELLPDFNLRNVVDTMHSVLVRRDALSEAGAHLDPAFPRLYDWELWLRLAMRFPVGYLPGEGDVRYRVHPEQMSGHPGRSDDFLDMFDHVDGLLAERAPELRLSSSRRARRRAGLMLSVALDRVQEDRPAEARHAVGGALRAWPPVVVHPRLLLASAGIVLGARGRAGVARVRLAHYRRVRSAQAGDSANAPRAGR